MTRRILLFIILSLISVSSFVQASPLPSSYPYAVITSSQGTSIHLSAEPGQRSTIYANATLHIFAPVNTSFSVYIDSELYVQNITRSEHTIVRMHLNATHHQIDVRVAGRTISFDVLVTRYAISENALHELTKMLSIPPWEWSAHEWAVFGDTLFGALLAIPFSIVAARYMILRKLGGANVIS